MANTLQNLFPFSTISPARALVYPCAVEFSAPITAGHYVFNDDSRVKFGKLLQQQTGVIAGVMISANCTPEDFAAAVDEPLKLQVYNGGNGTPVNLSPFPFSQFAHGDNYTCWFGITQAANYEDDFLLGLSGKVRQIANMTSNELKIKIAFNYWRIDKAMLEGGEKMRFEFTRDEISTLINALYIYRENVKAKMIKSKTESGRKVTARVLERVNKLYVFFVGAGHAKKDF